MPTPAGAAVADRVLQNLTPTAAAPTTTANFAGVGANGSAPSDSNGAVGPNYYFDLVNTELQIFTKTGASALGPETINTLWSGFGGECQSENDGDGTVRYDALADRWIVSQFALGPSGTGPFLQCVAVSTTADPTGSYYRSSFSFSNFPDYPKTAVWPDAYYQTMNTFSAAGSFLGAETCAYNRAQMLNGQLPTMQCFVLSSSLYGAVLPGDLDGVTPPPAGEPNTQIGLGSNNTHLASFKFHVDWNNPNNTSLSETDVPVAAYSGACSGGGTCIPQSGTTQQLDSLADRVMYRFAYRNLGDHESWVVNYTVAAGAGAAPRWWELRSTPPGSAVLTVNQESTYAPDTTKYRWMGATAMDQSGDIALGYSESSSTTKPAIAYTAHQNNVDGPGVMEAETLLYQGGGAQTTGLSRWGDYSGMSVDPSDGCTFWYTDQYIPSDGTFNWQTRIASFAFPASACPPRTASDFSMALSPASATVAAPGSVSTTVTAGRTAGAAQSIALSASGLPSGVTASFSALSIVASSGPGTGTSSTMTVTIGSVPSPGNYPITVNGSGTSTNHAATFTLIVPAPGIQNGGFETGGYSSWNIVTGSASIVTCGPHSGTYAAWLGGNSSCAATPTNGDSSIGQTFTLTQPSTLSFWYDISCPDTVTFDWATATLTDNTSSTTATLLPKTCTTFAGWVQVTSALGSSSVGHSFTLTLTNHDDNNLADPTVTKYDDVALTPTGLAAPTNLTATAVTTSRIDLSWTASSGATGYVLQRSPDAASWATIASPSTPPYSDTGLSPGTLYYYRVSASNSSGSSGYSNVASAITTCAAVPCAFSPATTVWNTNVANNAIANSGSPPNPNVFWQPTAAATAPVTYEVDLGSATPLSAVTSTWYSAGFAPSAYHVDTSADGVTWTTQLTVNASTVASRTDVFPGGQVTASFLRLVITAFPSAGANPYASLALVQFGWDGHGVSFPIASSSNPTWEHNTPDKAIDLNTSTWWQTISATTTPTLTVDLGVSTALTAARTQWLPGYVAGGYQIQTSPDGTTWTTRLTITANSSADRTDSFAAVNAQYLRLVVTPYTPGANPYADLALTELGWSGHGV